MAVTMTISEATKALGCSDRTLRRLISKAGITLQTEKRDTARGSRIAYVLTKQQLDLLSSMLAVTQPEEPPSSKHQGETSGASYREKWLVAEAKLEERERLIESLQSHLADTKEALEMARQEARSAYLQAPKETRLLEPSTGSQKQIPWWRKIFGQDT
jgi:DNA-binding transcriptional MerR regulator